MVFRFWWWCEDSLPNIHKIHEFCSNCMLLYCSWGEERAWTPYRNCQTRRKGTSHKDLRPSSTKQTTSWEESKATVTFFSHSGKMEQRNVKSYSTNWKNSLEAFLFPFQDCKIMCHSFDQFTGCFEWTGTKSVSCLSKCQDYFFTATLVLYTW